jgi:cellulose synthase (UDP-forming)
MRSNDDGGAVVDRPATVPGYWGGHRLQRDPRPRLRTLDEGAEEYLARPPRVPPLHRTTQLAYVVTLAGALVYAAFVINPANRGDLLPWLGLVVAEVILLLNAIGMIWTILAGDRTDDHPAVARRREELLDGRWEPSVDVFVTVYGEPLDVVALTIRTARDINGAHRTVVCDDGRSIDVELLCRELGVDYRSRPIRTGAKAGNLNYAMRTSTAEFIAVFDADHAPHPDFLVVTLPHFVRDEVAFVQSPQSYRNVHDSPIAEAGSEAQTIFYELVCPGKNAFDAQFHVGTNAVLRRSAIDSIGGLPEDTKSEDIWASLRMHRRGWSSVYVPDVLARGLAPTTMYAHLKQQLRWSTGAFEILLRGRPWRAGLTLDQRMQYLMPPLHYLQWFTILWFLLLPPMFVLFGVQPISADGETWLLRFLPFFVFNLLALQLQMGGWRPWSMAVSMASAPVYARAFFRVLFRRPDTTWFVTNQRRTQPSVVEFMPIQIIVLLVNVTALAVGLAVLEEPGKTAIALALCTLHIVMLGSVLVVATRDEADVEHRARRRGGLQDRSDDQVIDLRDHTRTGGSPR